MNSKLRSTLAASAVLMATQASAAITFYEGENFRGRAFTTDKQVNNFERFGFNDRASSVVVDNGRWEVCDAAGFRGNCMVLRRGSYDSLRAMGMNNSVSSVRRVKEHVQYRNEAPAPTPVPVYEYRRRPNERVYEANVVAVRAVVGPPERRCWVEKQEVQSAPRGEPNVGGAIVGGILGGVIGHQIGGGRGKDVATAGGAVAGAAIGANVGRESGPGTTYTRDVQRCERGVSGPPQYWDVTYNFRGVDHHAQLSAPPGPTIPVNANGEPRM